MREELQRAGAERVKERPGRTLQVRGAKRALEKSLESERARWKERAEGLREMPRRGAGVKRRKKELLPGRTGLPKTAWDQDQREGVGNRLGTSRKWPGRRPGLSRAKTVC